MGYFVGVKTIIFEHIEIASKIINLCHFCRGAILSVNHSVGDPSARLKKSSRSKSGCFFFGCAPGLLLLPMQPAPLGLHVENIMLKEIQKSFDARILEALGNGKKKYTEIRDRIGTNETGLLDKQLKILLDMETIQKTEPINRRNDKKKQFYEITDNLMRFNFRFIFGKAGTVVRIGEAQYYARNIQPTLTQFISRRLEGITLQYFHRMAVAGKYPDVEDFGSYRYDDPETKTNGEFDCVMKRSGDQYDFYECKYFEHPMTLAECEQEREQLRRIREIAIANIGFVCTGGFALDDPQGFVLIDGEQLYQEFGL